MRALSALLGIVVLLGATGSAAAAPCPGNPDAIGTSRVIVVDPSEHSGIGTMQYHETLPLEAKEVVLTFDDGPLPHYTSRILETLAAECVKATFFMVGRQARAFPQMVRRVYNEGHTVASHSQNHPRIFTRLPLLAAESEIEQGMASVVAALGDERALAPFFRFPGLGRSPAIEAYLASRGVMAWSADFPADDWTHISAQKVMARALERIERKGKGVLLLHDIQPATVLALPSLLKALKERGYSIVHVVPAGPDRPKTVTEPDAWVMHKPVPMWPRVVERVSTQLLAPRPENFGHPELIGLPRGPADQWPPVAVTAVPASQTPTLPAPSVRSFGLPRLIEARSADIGSLAAPDEVFSPLLAPTVWPIGRKPAARARPVPHRAAVVPMPPRPPMPHRFVSRTPLPVR